MTYPRLEIDLAKVEHNASALVARLKGRGVSVTGVTKSFLGSPQIARALLRGGVRRLGDSRIENLETMRAAGIRAEMMLIRSPMLSQVGRVVASADISLNTEIAVLSALSIAAVKARATHSVVLMVELGDLREGLMPRDLETAIRIVRKLPNLKLAGVGTNLACRSGVSPDSHNMAELSRLADTFVPANGLSPVLVTGGNSANLNWAFEDHDIGRINDLRLGEAIMFGREALDRKALPGLYTDAISLVAEVIESNIKPSLPWGKINQTAFHKDDEQTDRDMCNGLINQSILAIGRQDTDSGGLTPPPGIRILDASSDHLMLDTGDNRLAIGSTVALQPNYSAFLRAMTSSNIIHVFERGTPVAPDLGEVRFPTAA